MTEISYKYSSASPSHAHAYLLPSVKAFLRKYHKDKSNPVFDLGCGNGSVAQALTAAGFLVRGVDPSSEGIAQANAAYPDVKLEVGSAYDDLRARYGQFDTVVSLEVVEHVYAPRDYAKTLADLLRPGGHAIISTPYHGYLKNLVLAASGKMDKHFTALWDHGHIKFWSIETLTELMREAGLKRRDIARVGRVPVLAKSMILVFHKP